MIGLWECGMLRVQPMTNMLNVYRFTMLAAEVRNIGFELVKDNTNIELAVSFKEQTMLARKKICDKLQYYYTSRPNTYISLKLKTNSVRI